MNQVEGTGTGGHEAYEEDLPGLLRGELSRARHQEVVTHLHRCEECRQVLVDAASSHGGLVAVRRILSGAAEPLHLPKASPMAPLPARSSRTRYRAAGALAGHSGEPARWPRGRELVAAAVIAVLAALGGAGVDAGLRRGADRTPTASGSVRSAPLSAVGPVARNATGVVTMRPEQSDAATVMTVRVTLAPAKPGQFYYAWLLDPATQKMLPLGVVGPAGAATFDIQTSILRRYQAVDVSLESDNGNPAHSATSVLRATY